MLVDPRNVDEIAAGIRRLLDDPALRRVLTARGRARAQQFSWRRAAEESLKVYELAARRGRRAES